MADTGPFSIEKNCFGQEVPCYALTFNKEGACTSPKSLDHLITSIAASGRTDVILFSHGWNNDWPTARERYMDFLHGVSQSADRHTGLLPNAFRPVFVGIHWPSTILTWPSEDAPEIAGGNELRDWLSDVLDAKNLAKVDALLAKETIGLREAQDLASSVAPVLGSTNDLTESEGDFNATDLVEVWRHAEDLVSSEKNGAMSGGGLDDFGSGGQQGANSDRSVAGWLESFSPRNLVRLTTVLMMKDRAGIVGAAGVADVLRRILDDTAARLHLVGHSYGAKVVMTALVRAGASRPAYSALLLQPAVSQLAFAKDIGTGTSGGFRSALARVKTPIFTTYSPHDFPLTRVFHWAARRRTDLGELQAAGSPPSKYAALGGYGPSGLLNGEGQERILPADGAKYDPVPSDVEMVTLNGATGITGHGDVTNPYTFWAMHNLMR